MTPKHPLIELKKTPVLDDRHVHVLSPNRDSCESCSLSQSLNTSIQVTPPPWQEGTKDSAKIDISGPNKYHCSTIHAFKCVLKLRPNKNGIWAGFGLGIWPMGCHLRRPDLELSLKQVPLIFLQTHTCHWSSGTRQEQSPSTGCTSASWSIWVSIERISKCERGKI